MWVPYFIFEERRRENKKPKLEVSLDRNKRNQKLNLQWQLAIMITFPGHS